VTAVQSKTALGELAVFSNSPAFAEPLHVGRPNIGDESRLLERISGILERRWLTNDGELAGAFEAAVAELVEAKECVLVVNATVGLQLLARALDLSGEVILPSWTFVGTAHALSWVGLTPVFCDIDPDTHNLDPDAVERAVTERTSAILGVHLWGRPCAPDRLAAIADRHGVPLIFDAAHALACSYRGRAIGGLGTAEVFSFHATKIATSGEGGAITTDDAKLAARLRRMRSFGFHAYDAVSDLGTNGKMSEFAAAMGLTSLESLDTFIEVARRNYLAYARALKGIAGLRLLDVPADERHNYHYVVLELTGEDAGGLSRDELVTVLHAENVLARRYFHPGCHRHEPYRSLRAVLPVTEAVSSRVIVLPTGTAVDERDIETICSIIEVALHNGAEVRRRLEGGGPFRGTA
jgi:dTDP-4-amino-4,6-dideoxygalactose transaminase